MLLHLWCSFISSSIVALLLFIWKVNSESLWITMKILKRREHARIFFSALSFLASRVIEYCATAERKIANTLDLLLLPRSHDELNNVQIDLNREQTTNSIFIAQFLVLFISFSFSSVPLPEISFCRFLLAHFASILSLLFIVNAIPMFGISSTSFLCFHSFVRATEWANKFLFRVLFRLGFFVSETRRTFRYFLPFQFVFNCKMRVHQPSIRPSFEWILDIWVSTWVRARFTLGVCFHWIRLLRM